MQTNKLKEYIKEYIREKNRDHDREFNPEDVSKARKHLKGLKDQRFLQSLTRIDSLEEVQALMLTMIEFINQRTPGPNLNKQTAMQAIQKATFDDFIIPKDKDVDVSPEPEVEPEEEEVEEVSTSAGAGSYNTKYAFRLPKNHKEVK